MRIPVLFATVVLLCCRVGSSEEIIVREVKFEPVFKGLNFVDIEVENISAQPQLFAVHIYTRSPQFGKKGVGWGKVFFYELKANEKQGLRVPYIIQGPVTPDAYVRLSLGNPTSEENFHPDNNFRRETFTCDKLQIRQQAYEPHKADEQNTSAAVSFFEEFKQQLLKGEYNLCWSFFTETYQTVQFDKYENFKKAMDIEPPFALFCWKKNTFINLVPAEVVQSQAGFHLFANSSGEKWRIDLEQDGDSYKIFFVDSPSIPMVDAQDWESILLPKLEHRLNKNLDVYCYKDSTAYKDIDLICSQRQAAIERISEFAGLSYTDTIKVVFFEDASEKFLSTAHQGDGWAIGSMIVEVYNKEVKLNPYHEIAHIIMGKVGQPPAAFNEGFAVYISELFGSESLRHLGGEGQTVLGRTRDIKKRGELVSLEKLMTYTEIGSEQSNPESAYPQAACLVKYLNETYGKELLLKAYKNLKNPGNRKIQAENLKKLSRIYGKNINDIESDWHRYIDTPD